MIAIVLGPDAALARATVRDLVNASDAEGRDTTWLDGKTVSVNDVMMAAASVGFFSSERTIVVEDLLQRHAKGTGKGAEADWASLFSSVPGGTTLILHDPSVQTVPAAVKKLLPGDARVIASDPPRGRDLVAWVVERARHEGGAIDNRTATTLLNTLYPGTWNEKSRNPAFDRPPDMDALGNEIAKLVTAALPGPVTPSHIAELTDAGESDNVFAFLDAALTGDLARAVPALDALLANGEDPHKLLAQLAGRIELAGIVAAAGRRDLGEVSRDIRDATPARLSSVARGMGSRPPAFYARVVRVMEETDRSLKTGEIRDPVDALHATIARIGSIRATTSPAQSPANGRPSR